MPDAPKLNLKTKFVSSLAKILPEEAPGRWTEFRKGSALGGEVFSFQVAFYQDWHWHDTRVTVHSPLAEQIRVRYTDLVPVDYLPEGMDEDVITTKLGLYPDCLKDLDNGIYHAPAKQWRSLWVTVYVPKGCKPGKYPISLKFSVTPYGEDTPLEFETREFTLEVIGTDLPEQTLINTHWFHSDCLATYYGVKVFSAAWWKIVRNFMECAVLHGQNMILTPVFTPPLDTAVGGERPTVQLVGVTRKAGKYSFDFTLLDKWVDTALAAGMKYFEISHLFTQWGATATPKIMAKEKGKPVRIFGWDTASDSKEYTAFLNAFLPALLRYLQAKGVAENTYFHTSDEPNVDHLDKYGKAVKIMRKNLKGCKFFDALSHVEYFKNGLISIPVPSESRLLEFLKENPPERWTYYCCGPVAGYSNRFIFMNSARNRIFGSLLYTHKIQGFLHWGYNFYYSRVSLYPVNPYASTTAGGAYPPGDGFLVYPGPSGEPVDSLRHEVFHEALQDLSALQKLETMISRTEIMKLLNSYAPNGKMAIDSYPKTEKEVLGLREKVNQLIKKNL